jgi:hypothetical protein
VLLRRWRNTMGRTIWDFPGGRTAGNRYLALTARAVLAPDRYADIEVHDWAFGGRPS